MINIREWLGLNYYTSELDQFLSEYDKTHPRLSADQRKEFTKYQRIYKLRDDPKQHEPKKDLWDKF